MPEQITGAYSERPLILRGRHVDDRWGLWRGDSSESDNTQSEPHQESKIRLDAHKATTPGGRLIAPLEQWQASAKGADIAPWLASDVELSAELAAELASAPLIAIDFPVFTDGRGYSTARLLRERYGYQGEIRAVGDVLIDQLFYLSRCGFDAFSLREDQIIEDALRALKTFSRSYQPGVDSTEPLFRRRLREMHERNNCRAHQEPTSLEGAAV
ncbi:DUF934 domain-containing protein [Halomonas halocynthiae]|uniref:DUF934 domain-containing protein n=1 Tax=Halomonas halocynthiae TaxID=176290 RepID=UPI0004077995|nr:DUF934 domain-containing protein [Halomonas halocynthiae]